MVSWGMMIDLVSVLVSLPDVSRHRYRCREIATFCDDVDWPVLDWKMLLDQDGHALPGEAQEGSWFYTPEDREGESASRLFSRRRL